MDPINRVSTQSCVLVFAALALLLPLAPAAGSGQGPGLACWNITLEDASARCVIPGIGGGFVIGGQAKGDEGKHLLLRKVDDQGQTVWSWTYQQLSGQAIAKAMLAEEDRYILACDTAGSGAGDDRLDMMLASIDDRGYLGWNETLVRGAEEYATGICRSADQGYVLSGYALSQGRTRVDAIAAKFAADTTLVWTKDYPSAQANAIAPAVDGGYVLAGSRDGDGLVFKIDEAGDVVWERTYGGPEQDMANAIVHNGKGGYLVAGFTESSGAGSKDFWAFEIDALGEKAWERTYGTPEREEARSMAILDDGFVLGGYTGTYPMGAHFVGIDTGGDVMWETGFMPTKLDMAFAVASAGDGFVGVGSRGVDLFALGCGEAAVVAEGPVLLAALFPMLALVLGRSIIHPRVTYPRPLGSPTGTPDRRPRTTSTFHREGPEAVIRPAPKCGAAHAIPASWHDSPPSFAQDHGGCELPLRWPLLTPEHQGRGTNINHFGNPALQETNAAKRTPR